MKYIVLTILILASAFGFWYFEIEQPKRLEIEAQRQAEVDRQREEQKALRAETARIEKERQELKRQQEAFEKLQAEKIKPEIEMEETTVPSGSTEAEIFELKRLDKQRRLDYVDQQYKEKLAALTQRRKDLAAEVARGLVSKSKVAEADGNFKEHHLGVRRTGSTIHKGNSGIRTSDADRKDFEKWKNESLKAIDDKINYLKEQERLNEEDFKILEQNYKKARNSIVTE